MRGRPLDTVLFSRGTATFAVAGERRQVDEVAALVAPFVSGRRHTRQPAASPRWWTLALSPADGAAATTVFEIPSKLNEPGVALGVSLHDRWLAPREALSSLDALRVVRGFLRAETARRPVLSVHGAMVGIDGSGIALLGAKRSGKTSTLLALMRDLQASLVANDDLMLDCTRRPIVGLGWPRTVGVRPRVRAALLAGTSPEDLAHPLNRAVHADDEDRDSLYLFPAELVAVYGTRVEPSLPLRAAVFPRWGSTTEVQQLPAAAAFECLRELIDDEPSRCAAWVCQVVGVEPRPGPAERLARDLVAHVPCLTLTQNLDRMAESAEALGESLVAVGAVPAA